MQYAGKVGSRLPAKYPEPGTGRFVSAKNSFLDLLACMQKGQSLSKRSCPLG
jgi:hypothetical protein